MRISDWSQTCALPIFLFPLGFPVTHGEGVADDARSRLQLGKKLGPELGVQAFKKIKRHHRRLAEISGEQVLVAEGDKIRHPRFSRIRLGFRDPLGVDVYPDGPNAMSARCRHRDTAIARTQIKENAPHLNVCSLAPVIYPPHGKRAVWGKK